VTAVTPARARLLRDDLVKRIRYERWLLRALYTTLERVSAILGEAAPDVPSRRLQTGAQRRMVDCPNCGKRYTA
jgi:hypothetical protein